MTATTLRIAVVGGGIAGLTLTLALRTLGFDCAVYERRSELSEAGAGVQLSPNAARLLHRLGLAAALRRTAVEPRAIELRRWADGAVLRRVPLQDCRARFGAPYYTVHRADLHRALVERIGDEGMHLGRGCAAVTEYADDAEVAFDDGSSVRADVVVGADGVHSRVRALLADDRPRFSGQSVFRALVPAASVPPVADRPQVTLWLGPGRHCVAYPIATGRTINLVATAPEPAWRVESWQAEGSPADLAAAYDGWAQEVRALTAAPARVSQWALHDRDPLPRWSTARVTLVGDAAHPMLPFMAQGANQAVEDAAALAASLHRITARRGSQRDAIAVALARYEAARRSRTDAVQAVSRRNTDALHLPDGAEQRRRDAALAAGDGLEDHAWLYAHDAAAEVPA